MNNEERVNAEAYLNQLNDSIQWLEYEVQREDNTEKKIVLENELNQARDQRARITNLME